MLFAKRIRACIFAALLLMCVSSIPGTWDMDDDDALTPGAAQEYVAWGAVNEHRNDPLPALQAEGVHLPDTLFSHSRFVAVAQAQDVPRTPTSYPLRP